ncbi:hypothetical protein [Thermostichus vulcanus]|uniref:Uncharacterized protein n=1 Tax=Thermostichus vulcanus str. 'Rupite' TaxID=2813851 RepID=A0ABT0CEL2_THEVL|nr:hypothetical protein [Thermostichus vulcanus]MCJ2544215.1 hypothetical protein [Thermostichus vulcanus str. 'Rupite']
MFRPTVLPLMPSGRPLGWLADSLWASCAWVHRGDLFIFAQPQAAQGSMAAPLAGIRRRSTGFLFLNALISTVLEPIQQGSFSRTCYGIFHHHRSRRYRARLAVPH